MNHKICKAFNRQMPCGIFEITLRAILILMILLQNMDGNVEAKSLHTSKKTWKLKSSSTLVQLRHKRDTLTANQQEQPLDYDGFANENYDVIPDMSGDTPPSLDDHISESAKQIAESFSNLWQTIIESVKAGLESMRSIFVEEEYELTAEQEKQLHVAMEQQNKAKNVHENEVSMNGFEYQI